jgi:ATP-dependent DNA helicase RecG
MELSEGRGTGVPKILRSMQRNGSQTPLFETDEQRTSFLVRLPLRAAPQEASTGQVEELAKELVCDGLKSIAEETGQVSGQVAEALKTFFTKPRSAKEIQSVMGLRHRETFIDNHLNPLLQNGVLERTIPEKPKSRLQKYRLTEVAKTRLASG